MSGPARVHGYMHMHMHMHMYMYMYMYMYMHTYMHMPVYKHMHMHMLIYGAWASIPSGAALLPASAVARAPLAAVRPRQAPRKRQTHSTCKAFRCAPRASGSNPAHRVCVASAHSISYCFHPGPLLEGAPPP
jgi:hypothetical protein